MFDPTVGFEKIHPKEIDRIIVRRNDVVGKKEGVIGNPQEDATGLALSGGGIRSATFNLGIIQALQRHDVFKYIDYLSTVSGGGYIGSCLTWCMSKLRLEKPFGVKREDHSQTGGKVLAWLRNYGNYLAPGFGANIWILAGAVLTGTLSTCSS
jgi:predicted acylesterase/phospholipase RssA